jgi:hypothetical protein
MRSRRCLKSLTLRNALHLCRHWKRRELMLPLPGTLRGPPGTPLGTLPRALPLTLPCPLLPSLPGSSPGRVHALCDAAWKSVEDAAAPNGAGDAHEAAWDAVVDATRDTREAAWDVQRIIGWAATRDTAWDAARTAAWNAAQAAVWDAVMDTTRVTAGAAAWNALNKTRLELQQSALALVERMIAALPG